MIDAQTVTLAAESIDVNKPDEEKPLIDIINGSDVTLKITKNFTSDRFQQSLSVKGASLKAEIGGALKFVSNDNTNQSSHSEIDLDDTAQYRHPNTVEVTDGTLDLSAGEIFLNGLGKNSRGLLVTGLSKATKVSITSAHNHFKGSPAISIINPRQGDTSEYQPVDTTLTITATGTEGNLFDGSAKRPDTETHPDLFSSLKVKQGTRVSISADKGKNTFTTTSTSSEAPWIGVYANSDYDILFKKVPKDADDLSINDASTAKPRSGDQ